MISIKTEQEIEIMSESGRILAGIMDELEKNIKQGISALELDRLTEYLISKSGGKSSFKGYQGFPACICVSINEEVVHGAPSSNKIIKQGDIVSLDIGLFNKGFHVDMAKTFAVGKVNYKIQKMIKTTEKALIKGIGKVKPDNTFGDIGHAIQKYVEEQGFTIIRGLFGHGIGRKLHEDPLIFNFGKKGEGEKIKQGMTFCIEPIIGMGDWRVKQIKNGFAFQTVDNSLSCHFEHTVAVTQMTAMF